MMCSEDLAEMSWSPTTSAAPACFNVFWESSKLSVARPLVCVEPGCQGKGEGGPGQKANLTGSLLQLLEASRLAEITAASQPGIPAMKGVRLMEAALRPRMRRMKSEIEDLEEDVNSDGCLPQAARLGDRSCRRRG